ncbi:hypothetical protein ACH4A7_38040 [Streptomyces cyaneofuscatus]|uniref:hypothetical protein n=1 Tax=Streptomyces cyaneofuscatus TaxID=66883 RepID=UPI0037B1985A
MDKLIELAVSVVSGGLVALLTWWLTTRSRDRQDEEREREALRGHADALVVAVSDLRAAYVVNRMLWERGPEILRTVALTAIAVLGGATRARVAGGTDMQGALVGAGRGAELLAQERIVGKQALTALREPFNRIAAAAAPLLRCSAPALVTATEELLSAAESVTDTVRLEEKLAAFGRASLEATTPPETRRERRRSRRSG